jgi:DNA-binding protein YbaB
MALPREYEQRYEKLQNDLLELQKSIQELSETAYAPVGARGELRDLVLDPRIYRSTDAKALAATIKQTIWDASSAVSARLIELTRPMLPTDGSGDGIDLEAALGNLAPVDGVSG